MKRSCGKVLAGEFSRVADPDGGEQLSYLYMQRHGDIGLETVQIMELDSQLVIDQHSGLREQANLDLRTPTKDPLIKGSTC